MIKYQTKWHGHSLARIAEIEVLRETDKQVVLLPFGSKGKERRENKVSEWQCWFDTWEEAHDFLVDEAKKKVGGLRLDLQAAIGTLGNAKGMKKSYCKKET